MSINYVPIFLWMAQNIHYRENIYFIHRIIKTILDTLKMDIDEIYFAEWIFTDSRFALKCIKQIYTSLIEKTKILERPEYLKLLLNAVYDLSDVIIEMEKDSSALSKILENLAMEIHELSISARMVSEEIENAINNILENESTEKDVVSHDELSELLHP